MTNGTYNYAYLQSTLLCRDILEPILFGKSKVDILVHYTCILISTALASCIMFLIYYYLFLPWDIRMDLCDVGFDYLTDGSYRSARYRKKNKRELVREVQRLRKIGDLPPIYPNGWFALLESEDLKKNEVKNVSALGENFAVFRNDIGEVKILDAYCPHLGANMAIGGKVRGNCIECPFHSWTFDGDTGYCSSVPYAEKTPNFAKVKKWESLEVNDCIFVWYHAENEKPSWYPNEILKKKKWAYHGRSELLTCGHIQDYPENGADIYHINAVHGPSLLAGPDLRFSDNSKFMSHVWNGEWSQHPKESHIGVLKLSFETKIFNKFSIFNGKIVAQQIGPGYMEFKVDTSLGPILFITLVTPIEALVQKITHRMYGPYKQIILAKAMLYASDKIQLSRDVMIWNHRKCLSKPVLAKEDKAILTFRRWYSQFYSENSPTFNFQKNSVDW